MDGFSMINRRTTCKTSKSAFIQFHYRRSQGGNSWLFDRNALHNGYALGHMYLMIRLSCSSSSVAHKHPEKASDAVDYGKLSSCL